MSAENPNYLNELLDNEVRIVHKVRRSRSLAAATIALTCISSGYVALSSEQDSDDTHLAIAIIPYEMNIDDAIELGESVETSFNDLTNDILTVDVTVIEPSYTATQRYQDINSDNCIDKSDLSRYGSYIASSAMPELHAYDKVLALNADPACQNAVGGVAQLQGRYGEVFNAASSWEVIQDNGGTTLQEKNNNGNVTTTTYLYSPVGTGVHEMLHLFGLGHNGTLTAPKDRSKGETYTMRVYSETPRDVTIDVHSFVARQIYDEYGSVEVMGKGILDLTEELTILEQHILSELHGVHTESTAIKVHELSDSPLVFALSASETIITHRLREAIELTNNAETRAMTSLAFVPIKLTEQSRTIKGLTVYLVSDDKNSVEVGTLANLGEAETTYTLQLGTEIVTVHLDYIKAEITLALKAKD